MSRLLDLFCGAGGAAEGYRRAGFEVVGVDISPQPHFPFEFHQADVLDLHRGPFEDEGAWIEEFDAIHASPPCQGYTTMNNRRGAENTPQLIHLVRDLLNTTGLPWVIENVDGAKSHMVEPIRLYGAMFGLGVHRPRQFESSFPLEAPAKVKRQNRPVAVYGKQDGRRIWTRVDGSELRVANLEQAKEAMGIDWMTWDEIREAIPPAYTEYIGKSLLMQIHEG